MAAARPPVDRSAPPPLGASHGARFPRFLRSRLANGLTVLAARLAGQPLVGLELIAPAGGQYEPAGGAGTAALTAGMLDEGTARRPALEIAAFVERLGGYLAAGADWDVAYLSAGLLAGHRRAGLDLLAEVAVTPTFPEAEIERLRRMRLSEIVRRRQDPAALADERFQREVYGGTVYGLPLQGTEESVAGLDRAALVGFYERHYAFAGATLVAAGDLDPEELLREAEDAFGAAPPPALAGPPPARPEILPRPLEGVTVHVVDRPGAAQTELRLGHVGVPRTHPDFVALTVLNSLLGGKFTSRINLNLRERHGYTYGATSRFSPRQGPGPFAIAAAVETPSVAAAAREVLREMRRVREELVEPAELAETASYIVGVFPYTLQTVGDISRRLETLVTFGLPDDYYDHYGERILAVGREQVREAARRHLDPERIAVVAVGPADVLAPQLEGLGGPVTVWSPEGEPRAAPAARTA